MNQIIVDKKTEIKKKCFFEMQLMVSVFIIVILITVMIINYNKDGNLENISKTIEQNIRLADIYKTDENMIDKLYFGKIIINKINLEYVVFDEYSEELLKIAPCKFYGENLGEEGNICIAAHNYNDNRFFGRIAELNLKDEIKIIDLDGKEFNFIVYDCFEIEENDFSILKADKKYELTLLTCNNSNRKRVIIKAYMKEY